MSVLSRDEILQCIKEGSIVIDNFDEKNLGPASYDLTLSNEFRHFKPSQGVIDINDSVDYKKYTELYTVDCSNKDNNYYVLPPHTACLGITEEHICLSDNICGLLEGRSRFARMGLFVHITAGFMNPGISNRQVLEIYNASPNPLKLHPGTKICQFVFMKMSGHAKYTGQFKDQSL